MLTEATTGSVLRNFAKLIGKDLSGKASAGNFIKKEALVLVFSCDFREISKNTFFTEHLYENVSALITYHGRQACRVGAERVDQKLHFLCSDSIKSFDLTDT